MQPCGARHPHPVPSPQHPPGFRRPPPPTPSPGGDPPPKGGDGGVARWHRPAGAYRPAPTAGGARGGRSRTPAPWSRPCASPSAGPSAPATWRRRRTPLPAHPPSPNRGGGDGGLNPCPWRRATPRAPRHGTHTGERKRVPRPAATAPGWGGSAAAPGALTQRRGRRKAAAAVEAPSCSLGASKPQGQGGRAGGTFARRSPRNAAGGRASGHAACARLSRTTGREAAPCVPPTTPRPLVSPASPAETRRARHGSQGPARGFIYKRGRAGWGGPRPIHVCTRGRHVPRGPPPRQPHALGGGGPAPGGPLSSLGREGRGKQGVLGGFEGPGRGHQRPKCHQTASRACPQRRRGKERPRVRRGGRVGGLRGGAEWDTIPPLWGGLLPLVLSSGCPRAGGMSPRPQVLDAAVPSSPTGHSHRPQPRASSEVTLGDRSQPGGGGSLGGLSTPRAAPAAPAHTRCPRPLM